MSAVLEMSMGERIDAIAPDLKHYKIEVRRVVEIGVQLGDDEWKDTVLYPMGVFFIVPELQMIVGHPTRHGSADALVVLNELKRIQSGRVTLKEHWMDSDWGDSRALKLNLFRITEDHALCQEPRCEDHGKFVETERHEHHAAPTADERQAGIAISLEGDEWVMWWPEEESRTARQAGEFSRTLVDAARRVDDLNIERRSR